MSLDSRVINIKEYAEDLAIENPGLERFSKLKKSFTSARIAAFLSLLRDGVTIEDGCAKVGWSVRTFNHFLDTWPNFRARVYRAEAEAIIDCNVCIMNSVRGGDAKIALEVVKRRRPKAWSETIKHGVDADVEKVLKDLENLASK